MKWLLRLAGAIIFPIIGQGVLLWLWSRGIHPERWVANGLGIAESTWGKDFIYLLFLGTLGLIGLLLGPVIWHWGNRLVPSPDRGDHWTERKQVEIHVLANVSVGRSPTASPIKKEPELSRFRELKDAITRGELDADLNGERANWWSTVALENFRQYVAATNKSYWLEVFHRWEARQDVTPSPRGRITLLELLRKAEAQGWKILDPNSLHILDVLDGIRQTGVDNDVAIYGRRVHQFPQLTHDEPLVRIPSEHWLTHEIDLFTCLKWHQSQPADYTDDNHKTRVKGMAADWGGESFADVHLDRSDALAWLESDAVAFRGRRERHES